MAKRKNNLESQVKAVTKQLNPIAIVIIVLCLVVGFVGGWFGYKAVTKNDTFVLNGNKEITLNLNETYVEQGAKIVAFGKDVSAEVKVEGKVDTTKEGEYALTYTINNIKYNGIKKVRIIRVVVENE